MIEVMLLEGISAQVTQDSKIVFQIFLCPKGQLISKCLFGVFNFFQKRTKTSQPEVS